LAIGIMAANMVGAPLAAGLLAMDGVGGLRCVHGCLKQTRCA
jgi:hypothetical protein